VWRRKEVATPADSAAADALDVLVMEGTRAALVPLVPAPDAGVLELPLPLFDPLFWYAFQTLSNQCIMVFLHYSICIIAISTVHTRKHTTIIDLMNWRCLTTPSYYENASCQPTL